AGQVPADQREGIRWRRDGQGAGLPGSYVRHQRPRTFDRWSTWTVGDAAGLGHFDRYLLAPLEGALHGRRLRWTVRRRQPASGGECLLAGLEDRARRPLAAIRSRFRRRARRLRRPALVWGADDPEDDRVLGRTGHRARLRLPAGRLGRLRAGRLRWIASPLDQWQADAGRGPHRRLPVGGGQPPPRGALK